MLQTCHTEPDRASVEKVLRELYGARAAGELERLCALFAPDTAFKISGSSCGSPISLSARGTEEVRSRLAVLVKTFRIGDREILSMVIDGQRAAVYWRADVHSRITGASVEMEFVDIVEVSAGRIALYLELFVSA